MADTSAGPYKNHTVVFLGSDNGHLLKVLASTQGSNASFSTQLLEDIDVYNPSRSVLYLLLFPPLSSFHLFLLLSARPLAALLNLIASPPPPGMLFFCCFLREQLVNSLRVPLFVFQVQVSHLCSVPSSDATSVERTGGSWAWSWTGSITPSLWRSPAA